MPDRLPSRRGLLEIAAGIAAGTALLPKAAVSQPRATARLNNEETVRAYFKAWETKDWAPFDALLADDFTFSSANDDDHISKAAFKKECWDTQIDFIKHFDIEALISKDDAVFVKYLCHTRNDRSFLNVEYHRVRDGRIELIECYFGEKSSFASAVASQAG